MGMLKRAYQIVRPASFLAWAFIVMAWNILAQIHLGRFAFEVAGNMITWLHAHPLVLMLVGFGWLGLLVIWPDIKKYFPTLPETVHQRMKAVENKQSTISTKLTELEDRFNKWLNSLSGNVTAMEARFMVVDGAVTGILARLKEQRDWLASLEQHIKVLESSKGVATQGKV